MAGSARAQQMANRFNWLNDQVIAFVEPLTEEQWAMPCGDDHRPIGVVAHHVATAYGAFTRWVVAMASGQPRAWQMKHGIAGSAHTSRNSTRRQRGGQ